MGQYAATDRSGAPKLFLIEGETPNNEEMVRIRSILNGEPQASVAPPKPPEEEVGFGANIVNNFMQGANRVQAGVDDTIAGLYKSAGNNEQASIWEQASREQETEAQTYKTRQKSFLDEETIGGKIANLAGQAAQTAPAMIGGPAAMIGGAAVGGPAGAAVGTAAALAMYWPQNMHGNVQRQIEEHGYVKDYSKAFAATGLQTGVEFAVDKVTLNLAGLGYKTVAGARKAIGMPIKQKTLKDISERSTKEAITLAAKRVGLPAAVAGVNGAAEEVIQQGLERWQAEMSVMPDEKSKQEYLESAIVGGLLEGAFGAGAGYVGHRESLKTERAYSDARKEIKEEVDAGVRKAETNYAAHEKARNAKYDPKPPTEEELAEKAKVEAADVEERKKTQLLLPDYSAQTREQLALEKEETKLPPGLRMDGTEETPDTQPSAPEFAMVLPSNFPVFQGERSLKNRSFMKALTTYGRGVRGRGTAPRPNDPFRIEATAIMRDTHEAETAAASRPKKVAKPVVKPEPGVQQGPVKPVFSETEYTDAVDKLRDFKSVSVDRVSKETGLPKDKAQAVFDEMLRRNDAYPAGSANQYLQVTVPHGMKTRAGANVRGEVTPHQSRDFIVKPVRPAGRGQQPYSVTVNGRRRKPRFATRDEAQIWITKNVAAAQQQNAQVDEDKSDLQYGIHRQHYRTLSNGEEHLVGEEVVNTYPTKEAADEAIKGYDPAYSTETNQRRNEALPVEEREAAIEQDKKAELGPISDILTKVMQRIVGKDRGTVEVLPNITRDYLKRRFPNLPDSALPSDRAVVEGLHMPADIKSALQNLIMLGADINSPNLTEEQRTQLIQEVLNHELIHLIRTLDLLTPKEWDVLFHAALSQKVPGKSFTWMQKADVQTGESETPAVVAEEAIAEMFRAYVKDPTSFRNPERGLLKKIADFVKKMIGLGQRHDAADLMEMIEKGGIADRDLGHGGLGKRPPRQGKQQEDTFYSLLKPDNFFLKSQRAIDNASVERDKGKQWWKIVKNASPHKEELDWLGIKDWLLNKVGNEEADKQDVLNFIQANSLDVWIKRNARTGELKQSGRLSEYDTMQLPGGEDYAEILFGFTPKAGEPSFKTGHFFDHNIFAHARIKTIHDEKGRKVLFIEEIQSDLHSQAAEHGYYSAALKPAYDEAKAEVADHDRRLTQSQNKIRDLGSRIRMYVVNIARVQRALNIGEQVPLNLMRPENGMATEADMQEMVAIRHELAAEHEAAVLHQNEVIIPERIRASVKFNKLHEQMNIPEAPLKTNWESYVAKRLIRHAAEHGYDAVAWHGSPESVAQTESFRNLTSEVTDKGEQWYKSYWSNNIPGVDMTERDNVTTIINRYIKKLPRLINDFVREFGAEVTHHPHSTDTIGGTPKINMIADEGGFTTQASNRFGGISDFLNYGDFAKEFPTRRSITRVYNKIKHRFSSGDATLWTEDQGFASRLVGKFERAVQVAQNQRSFDAFDALAGLNPHELKAAIIWSQGRWRDVMDFQQTTPMDIMVEDTSKPRPGQYPQPYFMLEVNPQMKEAFAEGNVPIFSVKQDRLQAIQANPRFGKWFKQSKAVDYFGMPKQFYHSTRADTDFSVFRRLSHFGSAEAANDRTRMAHLPQNPDQSTLLKFAGVYDPYDPPFNDWFWKDNLTDQDRADVEKSYHEARDKYLTGMRVMPVFLSVQRPLLTIDDSQQHTPDAWLMHAKDAGGISRTEYNWAVNNLNSDAQKENWLITKLEAKGYDSFEYTNEAEDMGSTSYAIFRPNQVKSVNNIGNWSLTNPDIYYSIKGDPGVKLGQKIRNGSYLLPKGVPNAWGAIKFRDKVYWGPTHADVLDQILHTVGKNDPDVENELNDLKYGDFGKITDGRFRGFEHDPYIRAQDTRYFGMDVDGFDNVGSEVRAVLGDKFSEKRINDAFERVAADKRKDPMVLGIKYYGEQGIGQKAMAFPENQPDLGEHVEPEKGSKWDDPDYDPRYDNDDIRYSMLMPKNDDLGPPLYLQNAPMGQRVPQSPPLDVLSEIHNKFMYDNLAPAVHKIINMTVPGSRARAVGRQFTDDTIITLQDRMMPVGRLIDRMKKNGGFITNENDTYLRETLFSGQTDAQLTENDRLYYKPLEAAISATSVTKADVDEAIRHFGVGSNVHLILKTYPLNPKHAMAELYLYAQHAQERNLEMRERNAPLQNIRPLAHQAGSGLGDFEAQQILDWIANKSWGHQYNDAMNPNSVRSRMRMLINNTNDVRVAGGLNPDFRLLTKPNGSPADPYKDYVPIRGILQDAMIADDDVVSFAKTGQGFNIRGKEDYSALGRETSLGRDIIANAIMQNQESVVRSNKNKVGQSFRQLILDNPTEMQDIAEILRMPRTKYALDRKRGVVRQIVDNSMMNDPTVLKVKVGGQQVFIKIKDERIARALNSKTGLGNTGLNGVMKALLKVNRVLAAMRTSYNPEFVAGNMLRDLEGALINMSEHEKKGIHKAILGSLLPALNGMRKVVRNEDRTSEWSKVADEFIKHGGQTAFYGIRDLEDTIRRINTELGYDASGVPSKVWKPIKWIGKFTSDYNLVVENGVRIATYRTLRDEYLRRSGNPSDPVVQKRAKEMAAFAAKNLTVNFNMGGEGKTILNGLYLFFNASMQGSMALLNPFIRNKKMRAIWGGVLVAGAVQDMLMSMISPEDDDGEKTYDKIPDHVFEKNFVFMDPFGISERGYFKLPQPYLLNAIYNWGRMLSKTARGKATIGEMLSSGGMTMVEAMNPFGGTNSFLNFVAPSIIDPFVDLIQNEDFTGSPVAPPISPYSNVNENRSQQYWANTNPAFVTVADWLSQLTGRKGDYLPGAIEVSPNQVEYVWEWLGGGTGAFITRAGWLASGAVMEPMPGEEITALDAPLVRRLYGTVTTRNDLQDYIQGRDEVLRIKKALKDARDDGNSELYTRLIREYPKEYRAAARITTLENARKKLSTKIKQIRESKKIPEDRKREMIKQYKAKQDMLVGKGNEFLEKAGID